MPRVTERTWVLCLLLSAAKLVSACSGDAPAANGGDAGESFGDAGPAPEENGIFKGPKLAKVTTLSVPATFAVDDAISVAIPASGHWTKFGSSFMMTGNLNVVTPAYSFTLGSGSLTAVVEDGVTVSLTGTAMVTMPELNTFSGLGAESPLSASFGYDSGESLADLGMPLEPARKYLYFTFSAGFEASFGTGPFSANTSGTRTVIIDPKDPAFYVSGPMGNLSAIALSEHGLIPFSAATTWGFDMPADDFPSFSGQSFLAGEVSLEEIPITVSGEITTRFDGWDGTSELDKTLFDHTLGVNGSGNIGWDFADGLFTLEVPVAKASLYLTSSAQPYRIAAAVSGRAGTSTFLPPWMPVLLSANSRIAGYIDSADSARNHLDGMSNITLMASTLGKLIGLPMNDLVLQGCLYHADRMGFRYTGISSTGLTPQLASESATITACFGGDAVACLSDDQTGQPVQGSKDWIVRMEGDTEVAGVPLLSATVTASPKGLSILAYYKTQKQQVTLTGSITPGASGQVPNVQLTGTADVNIRLTDNNEILKAVVNGALCGYKKITSAAKCGRDSIHFADEFHCGKPHCSWSWKHGPHCDSLSCDVKVPKTCDDLSRPKTCVSHPSPFDLGTVKGSVALTVTNAGLAGGKLSGTFCPAGKGKGSCQSLASVGKLDLSSITSPDICITSGEISSGLLAGNFCVDL